MRTSRRPRRHAAEGLPPARIVARPNDRRGPLDESLNLDFHSGPYFGEHPIVESHYLTKRSRRQPSILTFLAQDADS
jgi:hypothetical protein